MTGTEGATRRWGHGGVGIVEQTDRFPTARATRRNASKSAESDEPLKATYVNKRKDVQSRF